MALSLKKHLDEKTSPWIQFSHINKEKVYNVVLDSILSYHSDLDRAGNGCLRGFDHERDHDRMSQAEKRSQDRALLRGIPGCDALLGWLAGIGLKQYVQAFDHWIAFALLGFIGAKMIYEAIWIQEVEKKCDPLNLIVLLGLAIATSIDALAVGITFACLKIAIVTPALIIGCVTFLLCLAGVFIGNRMGDRLGSKMEVLGGIILIGMGLKILIQHLGVI